jgi:hypothetical protein
MDSRWMDSRQPKRLGSEQGPFQVFGLIFFLKKHVVKPGGAHMMVWSAELRSA